MVKETKKLKQLVVGGIESFLKENGNLYRFFFNIIAIISFSCGTISLIVNLFNEILLIRQILIAISLIIISVCFWIANGQKKVQLASVLMIGSITVFMFPTMFLLSGSISSGLGYWFVMGILFSILLVEGRACGLLVFIQFLAILISYGIVYVFSDMRFLHNSTYTFRQSVIDELQSLILISAGIGSIIFFQKKIYINKLDEISRKNKELDLSREEANKANMAKTDFLAKMSHEIRTPINAVIGFNEVILRECKVRQVKEYALNIKSAANNLLSIINEILDSTKIESGMMEIVNVKYEMSSLLNDLYNMFHLKAMSKKLDLIFDIDETIPCEYIGDNVRIRQILVNLLANAIKYTKNGNVTLEVKGEQLDNRMLLHFAVIDTGCGIKKEDIEVLFDRFKRVNLKDNGYEEGTGLGLNIASKLLVLMGSKLMVESVYGEGSVFFFDLEQEIGSKECLGDFKKRISLTLEDADYQLGYEASGARLLVVDDNELNLLVIKYLLKQTKIQVDLAKDGYQCIEMMKANHYDMVFLDHMMPNLDGIETLHIIKENPKLKSVPIVMLTANAVTGARNMYIGEGADDFLTKPVMQDKLDKMILKYIPKNLIKEIANNKISNVLSEDIDMEPLTGFEWDKAINILGTKELLMSSLEEFDNQLLNIIEKLEGDIGHIEEDMHRKNYQTTIHSLKSNTLMLGAMSLSYMSKRIEEACKEADIHTVRMIHKVLIQDLKNTKEILFNYLNKYGDKKLPTYSAVDKILLIENLKKGILEYDFINTKHNLNIIKQCYKISDVLEEWEVMLSNLDFEKLYESVDGYRWEG